MTLLASPPTHPFVPLPEHPDEDGLYPRDKAFLITHKKEQELFQEIQYEFFLLIRSYPEAKRRLIGSAYHSAMNFIHPPTETTNNKAKENN